MVEQVEDFDHPVDARAAAEREPALDAQVDPVQRLADEVVARHDRAVGAQAAVDPVGASRVPQIAAVVGEEARAGAVEVEAAQLEAVAHVPDAVEHRAMTLIVFGERVLAAEVRRHRERDFHPGR